MVDMTCTLLYYIYNNPEQFCCQQCADCPGSKKRKAWERNRYVHQMYKDADMCENTHICLTVTYRHVISTAGAEDFG